MIGIEDVEDVVGEGGGVTEGEKLFVDFLEFGFGEVAGGAVFEEACFSLIALEVSQAAGRRGKVVGVGIYVPLYHCCSSFLSKCVAFWRSESSCWESLL